MFAAVFGGLYFGAALPHNAGYQQLDKSSATDQTPTADLGFDDGARAARNNDSDEDDALLTFHDAPSDPAPHQPIRSVNTIKP